MSRLDFWPRVTVDTLDLFGGEKGKDETQRPLADRMRPRTIEEFVGQEHILGPGKVLRQAIENDQIRSIILWGPAGCGKTTLAHIIAARTKANFAMFSAVLSGVKEIRQVVDEAQSQTRHYGRKTILLVDEIHRFNKAQQDAFLPHVEKGTIILIGATTENPSFEVVSPLLSRTRVFAMQPLDQAELLSIMERALNDEERGLGKYKINVEKEVLCWIASIANGDARAALNILELASLSVPPAADGSRTITLEVAQDAAQRKSLVYDKAGEEHYNIISALHKSLRGSDPDAALYWLGRMLEAGEDPLYIARRLIRFASEDVGIADPQALQIAIAAMQAAHFVGMPECDLALAQAVVYLASAPKSNALYTAYGEVKRDIEQAETPPVPLHLRNPVTRTMKELGYGAGYRYPHDYPEAILDEEYLPEELQGRVYYKPTDRGFEAAIKERLERWRKLRKGRSKR